MEIQSYRKQWKWDMWVILNIDCKNNNNNYLWNLWIQIQIYIFTTAYKTQVGEIDLSHGPGKFTVKIL